MKNAKEELYKSVSVKITEELWREIMMMKINGEIRSINDAVLEGLKMFIKKYRGKEK